MTRIAIVGGHGQVARLLHPLLVAAGHAPVALVRKEEYRAELEGLGAEVRLLDIEQRGRRRRSPRPSTGCDAVVFAAGGGPDGNIERKRTVDLEGSLKSIEGAKAGPGSPGSSRSRRSASTTRCPRTPAPVWRAYVEAKRDADAALRDSGLDWTILRPGRLTDDPAPARSRWARTSPAGTSPGPTSPPWSAAVLDTGDGIGGTQWNLVGGRRARPVAARPCVSRSERPE